MMCDMANKYEWMNECEKYISVIFHCTKFKGGFSLILSKKRSTFFNRDNDLGPIYTKVGDPR